MYLLLYILHAIGVYGSYCARLDIGADIGVPAASGPDRIYAGYQALEPVSTVPADLHALNVKELDPSVVDVIITRTSDRHRPNRWKLQEKISSGGFGVVFKAILVDSLGRQVGEPMAVKLARNDPRKRGSDKTLVEEANRMIMLKGFTGSPNLLFAGRYGQRSSVIVMDLVPQKLQLHFASLPRRNKLELLQDGISLLYKLHTEFGMYHGDVKTSNLMVNEDGMLMFIDWDTAGTYGFATKRRFIDSKSWSEQHARGERTWFPDDYFALLRTMLELEGAFTENNFLARVAAYPSIDTIHAKTADFGALDKVDDYLYHKMSVIASQGGPGIIREVKEIWDITALAAENSEVGPNGPYEEIMQKLAEAVEVARTTPTRKRHNAARQQGGIPDLAPLVPLGEELPPLNADHNFNPVPAGQKERSPSTGHFSIDPRMDVLEPLPRDAEGNVDTMHEIPLQLDADGNFLGAGAMDVDVARQPPRRGEARPPPRRGEARPRLPAIREEETVGRATLGQGHSDPATGQKGTRGKPARPHSWAVPDPDSRNILSQFRKPRRLKEVLNRILKRKKKGPSVKP